MTTIKIEELPQITADAIKHALAEGEDIFITDDKEKRLAQVISVDKTSNLSQRPQKRRLIGSMKGLIKYMSDDFNEPLDDFKDYMPN